MRTTVDISGFGGTYEYCCQLMLEGGIAFLKEHPDFTFEGYANFPQITGIMQVPESAKDFETALVSHPFVKEKGTTGAMHQCVVGHLFMIHTKGYDGWIAEFESDPDRKFEFDGSVESCPTTELSERMDRA